MMDCKKCDEMDLKRWVAYYRVGIGNVGLIGCDLHLSALTGVAPGKVFVRVIPEESP